MSSRRLALIDIEAVAASLVFDVRTEQATGDGEFRFLALADGQPVFDLRQEVTHASLNGEAASPAMAPVVQPGTEPDQGVRAIRKRYQAGERGHLGVRYPIALPRASTMGTYQPMIDWRDGGVHFNFGFTDLGGGRYLEAWVPANLIFDRYRLSLAIRVEGTRTPHTLVTNGRARQIDENSWRVDFPDSLTALSPMVQLHPSSSLRSASQEVTLPVSRRKVKIEAHKFAGDKVRLSGQLDNIARWLQRNERELGPYHHGKRYTAFLHIGGMEYDGACTSSADALEHEVFHSWWARGLKPASQNDGWIDEALAVYFDHGGDTAVPFDFDEPAVTLCSANRWNRATPVAAYRQGFRFIQGLASVMGVGALRSALKDYYQAHAPGLVSTGEFEKHIRSCTADDATVRRAFARFVHGGRRPRQTGWFPPIS